tara:strand:- start:427 stop:840 length:414 start_codon:yes stop_codon:yes gene_type:complete
MANELVLLTELESPVGFTCADGTGIEKGTLLAISDPMTVAKVSGATPNVIGVAAEEKIANDGKTEIAVYMRGVFKATAGGSISVGASCMAEDGTNELLTATAAADASEIFAIALETAADTETFKVLFNAGIGGSPET